MSLYSLKLFADENIAASVVSHLRSKNIDVVDVREQNCIGQSDVTLLKLAFQQNRFILTQDSDFGTLVINEGQKNYGIIYLRLRDQRPQYVIDVIERFIKLDLELSPGAIVVVKDFPDSDKLRIRFRNQQ